MHKKFAKMTEGFLPKGLGGGNTVTFGESKLKMKDAN